MTAEALLEVDELTVETRIGGENVQLLRSLSFAIERGARIAIVGESGSGKSLTASSIMGLLPTGVRATSGSIRFNGTQLLDLSDREMSEVRGGQIAMVYQDPMSALNPVHRLGRQIEEAIRIHAPRTSRREIRERALQALADVGLSDPRSAADRFAHQFSGGMRQRVVIAMAMSTSPQLLIADEPTTALDVTTQARVLELLFTMSRRNGTSVLFITHDLSAAAELCDEVLVMYAGQIVEIASIGTFLNRPRHPYSVGLLAASRLADSIPGQPLHTIANQPPAPQATWFGCSFAARCHVKIDACDRIEPPLVRSDGGSVACHLFESQAGDRTGGDR